MLATRVIAVVGSAGVLAAAAEVAPSTGKVESGRRDDDEVKEDEGEEEEEVIEGGRGVE